MPTLFSFFLCTRHVMDMTPPRATPHTISAFAQTPNTQPPETRSKPLSGTVCPTVSYNVCYGGTVHVHPAKALHRSCETHTFASVRKSDSKNSSPHLGAHAYIFFTRARAPARPYGKNSAPRSTKKKVCSCVLAIVKLGLLSSRGAYCTARSAAS